MTELYVDGHYRMSAAGYCCRALSASRLGVPPRERPPSQERLLREASRQEALVVEDMEEQGWRVDHRQEETTLIYPPFKMKGHIDGLCRRNGSLHLLEIKTAGLFMFRRFVSDGLTAYPEYEWQISSYMHSYGSDFWPTMVVAKCRDNGELWPRDWPLAISEPPVSLDAILDKFILIEQTAREGELVDATYNEEADQCRWCRYDFLCVKDEVKLGELADDRLVAAAHNYAEAQELERAAKALKDPARKLLVAYMQQNSLERTAVAGHKCKLSEKTRKSTDYEELGKLLSEGDLQRVVKESTYSEFRMD